MLSCFQRLFKTCSGVRTASNGIGACLQQRQRSLHASALRFNQQDPSELDAYLQSNGYVDQQPSATHLSCPASGHNLVIVQPRVKNKPQKNTTDELQLAEAVALTETLAGWKASVKMLLNTENERKKQVFGKGNLEKIRDTIQANCRISALFLNIDILTGLQHAELAAYFGVPIYDRYTIVLNIFRQHARTKEAKLQVALAEIPYYRARIYHLHKGCGQHEGATGHSIGGSGESYYARRRRLLVEREACLRRQLEDIKSHRQLIRQKRVKQEFPIVAVVGYTNAGKTSLIKQLTGDSGLEPRNQLFATLDVTVHAGRLPSAQTALFLDTVGFISNIPTTLVASFMSTLEDVLLADIIVHVQDLSHPDRVAQRENVLRVLEQIHVPPRLLNSIVEVGNKVDLLSNVPQVDFEVNLVSSTVGTGIWDLSLAIEKQLIENTGRRTVRFRVPTGGPEYAWLYKEGTLKGCQVDNRDTNYINMDVQLTPIALARFKHLFGTCCIAGVGL
ncbi:putative GTP-binding protein 6 [Ornithodoros turicata]|uniref:putative GTP-binding protein 6 n=1 Tax=Ornithodoros turicata TaxID=34597 RepID=UPI0031397FFF